MQDIQSQGKQNNFSLSFLEDKIDLRKLVYSLFAHKWIILSFALIAFTLGTAYSITIVPKYQAKVLLQVENKQSGASLLNGAALLGSLNQGASPADVQITLMRSRFILAPVVRSLGLDVAISPHYLPVVSWFVHHSTLSKPLFGLNRYAWGGEKIQVSNVELSDQEEGKKFKLVAGENHTYKIFNPEGNLFLVGSVGQSIATDKNGSHFSILVKSLEANPGTEFFLTKLSTEYVTDKIISTLQISDLGQSYQMDKTGILQMSLTGPDPIYIVKLLNAIALHAVKKDTERKSIEAAKTLKILNEQLPLIKDSLNVSENALNQYRMKSGVIDLNLRSRMILKQLTDVQREIEKANIARIMLLQRYTPMHPYIIEIREKKIELEKELVSLEKELQTIPASDLTIVSLMRDIKVKNQLYLLLLRKIQELNIVKAGTVSDLRVLNLATIPNKSLPTGRGLVILTSLLFGFVLGCLFVILRKALHRVIEDPNWLEQQFGIPTFAIIPFSLQQKTNTLLHKEQTTKYLSLLAHTQPRDLSIEALRSLRTSLQFALIGAKNNIISIMGISPGIGKSFVSANFAHILSEAGKRILLIDGDIRKGYLHEYFGKLRTSGLSEVISGVAHLEDVIEKTHLPHLDFIPSGKFPPNPSELLMSTQFKDILAAASSRYDLVLIDTAPILAVTDGVIIGNEAGVNFLVIASSMHQAEEIELAVKRLQTNNVIVQGVIFNHIHAITSQGRYNYSYEYGEA